MSKTNRTHTPPFKAQVALAAIKGDRTTSAVAAHFQLHVNLVAHWKQQLLGGAPDVFASPGKGPRRPTTPSTPSSTNRSGGSSPGGARLPEKKICRPRLSGSGGRSSRATPS